MIITWEVAAAVDHILASSALPGLLLASSSRHTDQLLVNNSGSVVVVAALC